jgi:hypothetical protein
LESIVQEWIDLWTAGLAEAGVSPQQIYSHTAFLSRRSFGLGDSKDVTYMRHDRDTAYSQHNHFAPPSVAFGKNHRPGFSTYPQPGLFDDIYDLLEKHKQVGWASCEGTDMQPSSGPGQTGMNMETYLAKMFNHGATLVNIFSWGVGGDAMKTMGFRVVTEGEEALQSYRKFLKGEPLIEAKETLSLMERLPPKIHKIQAELPAWIQKTTNPEAAALMQKMQAELKAKRFEEAEKVADAILKMMGESVQPVANTNAAAQDIPEELRGRLVHELGSSFLVFRAKIQAELKLTAEQKEKLDQLLAQMLPEATRVLRNFKTLPHAEHEAYHRKSREEIAAVLGAVLDEGRRARLRQLELQRDGLFGGEIWKDLQITDEQRTQFMAEIRQTQGEIESLLAEIPKGASPAEIQPKVLKKRAALEDKLESLLTDAQKKQWIEMLGKPIELGALFDLTSR